MMTIHIGLGDGVLLLMALVAAAICIGSIIDDKGWSRRDQAATAAFFAVVATVLVTRVAS